MNDATIQHEAEIVAAYEQLRTYNKAVIPVPLSCPSCNWMQKRPIVALSVDDDLWHHARHCQTLQRDVKDATANP